MKIGVDVRYLSHGIVGGINTYLRGLIPELARQAAGHDLYLYADDKAPFDLASDEIGGRTVLRVLPYHGPYSTAWYDLFIRRALSRDKLDVVHFPANLGFGPAHCATVLTLHDSLTIQPANPAALLFGHRGSRPSLRKVAMTVYLNTLSRRAVRAADIILTVSEHARRDIAATGQIPADRIVAIPHAPGADMVPVRDAAGLQEVRKRRALPERFVLADALKNPGVLVRAWARLPEELRRAFRIVFFSRRPDPLPEVFTAVEQGFAQLIVRPTREELVAFYTMADVFVFPSWFEGFGLPLIEAMSCGAPVIASDRYSIPEVAGEAALIMDAEDDERLAVHLAAVLGSPGEAERLRQLGFARAATFSWQRSAAQTLAAYERAAQQRPALGTTSDLSPLEQNRESV